MKRFAIVSVVLLLIALLGVGAMYMTSNVTVIAQGVTALEAYRNYDLFTDLSAQVRAGAVVGTSFVAPQELSSAEDYVFYTYTFRLENNTTLPAEMIEVQITPMSGDILQIGSDQVLALPAHTIGDVTATILTSKDMHAIREANITYYIWGIPSLSGRPFRQAADKVICHGIQDRALQKLRTVQRTVSKHLPISFESGSAGLQRAFSLGTF